ncbi:F-box-like/WD repeat-containing protein TBL1XR1-A-like, partial [Trifolium medium]|nr:F-box-like/WD repeat-containing protein TBL1XR1-A-like [Trifolium medium]
PTEESNDTPQDSPPQLFKKDSPPQNSIEPDYNSFRSGRGRRGGRAFSSPTHPHVSLTLHNLLHVPTITKNLISETDDILLKGQVGSDGLYEFPAIALHSAKCSLDSKSLPSAHVASVLNKTACISPSKAHRLHSPSSHTQYNTPLELVYSDLWGPSPHTSTLGYKYYITFVDAYSKFTWIYLLK